MPRACVSENISITGMSATIAENFKRKGKEKMKKFIALSAAMLLAAVPVMADTQVNVTVNGKELEQKGVILEERTMVPVRGITEELGFAVDWDADTKTATLTNGGTVVKMTAGEKSFFVNDEAVTPDVPQTIIDGRFMLPLRALCDSINADVDWDNDTKTAAIKKGGTAETVTEAATETTTTAAISAEDVSLDDLPEGIDPSAVTVIVF